MTGLFERFDPRARLLAIAAMIAIVASTPPGALTAFPCYGALIALLILTGRASGYYLTWRCLAASPFILLAAGLLVWQGRAAGEGVPAAWPLGLSVALKGYAAALLLAFLTATTTLGELLEALRLLKAPPVLNLILAMMYRYTALLSEEYARMERARECRTVSALGKRRYSIFGHQFGTLILRSWDRAERVHAAMLSRGFDGSWPVRRLPRWRWADSAFTISIPGILLAARFLW